MAQIDVILSIDQGTTSSRTLVFSLDGNILYSAQRAFPQIFPHDGWVEHDPEEIWGSVLKTLKDAASFCTNEGLNPIGLGITNQRETTLVWDRASGKPIHNAIVWQDRRTADICTELKNRGHEPLVRDKTGLLLDPYFSASKIQWILNNVDGSRRRAEAGELVFGTVDTYLIWQLTGGKVHATDATNASRTCLYNIVEGKWDPELLDLFDVPEALLPNVKDCAADYGRVDAHLCGVDIPICGVAGDQQSALIGQQCFTVGEAKSTYGTGGFIVANTGKDLIRSKNNLLSTIGYQLDGEACYALEGSIFVAGAAIQWLRDGLELFTNSADTTEMAEKQSDGPEVFFVPALTGLGAPHWDPQARGAIFGLTRAATKEDFVRAALNGIVYQTNDLLDAMGLDGVELTRLRIDGGMAANGWFRQSLADITNILVECRSSLESTALGAARLVAHQLGIINLLDDKPDMNEFMACMRDVSSDEIQLRITRWKSAVRACQAFK